MSLTYDEKGYAGTLSERRPLVPTTVFELQWRYEPEMLIDMPWIQVLSARGTEGVIVSNTTVHRPTSLSDLAYSSADLAPRVKRLTPDPPSWRTVRASAEAALSMPSALCAISWPLQCHSSGAAA